jgi:CIC family chloride channel protein
MHPFPAPLSAVPEPPEPPDLDALPGPVTGRHAPQVLFASESLTQALRQLELYGRDGLPVIADDGQHVQGWITSQNVLQAVARHIRDAQAGTAEAPTAPARPQSDPPEAPTPLRSHQILEITIPAGSSADGRKLGDTAWPPGLVPVTVLHARTLSDPDPGIILVPGDRINLLAPAPRNPQPSHSSGESAGQPDRHPEPG